MTDEETKKNAKKIRDYLKSEFGKKIADKILEKIAKRLGVSTYLSFIKMDFPGKKLADVTVFTLKIAYFYGFYELNSSRNLNPYNPKESSQEDPYIEYLLYSWIKGNPGYIWQFQGVFNN